VGQGLEGRYGASRATDRVGHRYVLDGHTEVPIESLDEVHKALRDGDAAKRRAATAMNERSTRAHTIFMLNLSWNSSGVKSRFFFADLGGSEQLSKSQADAGTKAPVVMVGGEELSRVTWQEYYSHRQRVQETLNINMGLFSLKRVIEALHQRSRLSQEGQPPHLLPYVPYQDSKLTMLLQESLGGAARTLIITTATTDPRHAAESIQTVRFAETCAQVQKAQKADQVASVREALARIECELEDLQGVIRQKERWETQLVQRKDVDTIAGAFGEGATYLRHEVVHKSVLVGAEVERARLEQLLEQQAKLQGLSAECESKDFREMMQQQGEQRDGGRGVDFRERERFSARTKARDFEQETVLADALRFLFRRAPGAAAAFGETERSSSRRLVEAQIPRGYLRIAQSLRERWEDATAAGSEARPFGKAMLDRTQAWAAAFKDAELREPSLEALIAEVAYAPSPQDLLQVGRDSLEHIEEEEEEE